METIGSGYNPYNIDTITKAKSQQPRGQVSCKCYTKKKKKIKNNNKPGALRENLRRKEFPTVCALKTTHKKVLWHAFALISFLVR